MKTIFSTVIAMLVTGLLLFLMSRLIQSDSKVMAKPIVQIEDKIFIEDKPIKTEVITPQLPPPPMIEPTANRNDSPIKTSDEITIQSISVASIGTAIMPAGIISGAELADITENSAAILLYQAQPNYPMVAAQNGLEGWVRLQYDVSKTGLLSNIQVLEAKPRNVFNKAAVNALKKWKFKPAMHNGQAVNSINQQVTIEFELEEQ